MLSKLIAHVVFHFCGTVDDACYSHEKEPRVYFCVNAPYFDSTSCSSDSAVTRSFRLSFTSVNFLPTMAEAATRPMSYEKRVSMQPLNKCSVVVAVASPHYWPAGTCAGLTYSRECDNSCHVSVFNFVCALLGSSFLIFVCFNHLCLRTLNALTYTNLHTPYTYIQLYMPTKHEPIHYAITSHDILSL